MKYGKEITFFLIESLEIINSTQNKKTNICAVFSLQDPKRLQYSVIML